MSEYAPYQDLPGLMAAAGVSAGELGGYPTTADLLRRARERGGKPPSASITGRTVVAPVDGAPWSTRTIRLPLGLELSIDEKAASEGSNFSAVANRLLLQWVTS